MNEPADDESKFQFADQLVFGRRVQLADGTHSQLRYQDGRQL